MGHKKFPTVKGCGVLSIMNGNAIIIGQNLTDGKAPSPLIKEAAIPVLECA